MRVSLSPASGRGDWVVDGRRVGWDRGRGWVGWSWAEGVYSAGCLSPEDVDTLLQRCEGAWSAALQYAKNMAKYMKDLIGYLKRRRAG